MSGALPSLLIGAALGDPAFPAYDYGISSGG